ncbi:hypothetical protein C8J57DRAFT_1581492 [Mycena rebaudengoi]|nr:hypothetical protein C8J57DRAFT_1581492 [Mycena rebaudengoi]
MLHDAPSEMPPDPIPRSSAFFLRRRTGPSIPPSVPLAISFCSRVFARRTSRSSDDRLLRIGVCGSRHHRSPAYALPEEGLLRAWQDGSHYGALPHLVLAALCPRQDARALRSTLPADAARASASGGAAHLPSLRMLRAHRAHMLAKGYLSQLVISVPRSRPRVSLLPVHFALICRAECARTPLDRLVIAPSGAYGCRIRMTEMPAAGWAYVPRGPFLPAADLVQGSAYADRLSSVVIAPAKAVEQRVWA